MRTICLARGAKYSLETLAARSGVSADCRARSSAGSGTRPSRLCCGSPAPCSRLTWPKERLTWEILTPPGIREFTLMRGIIPPRFDESEFTRPKYYHGMFCDRPLAGQVSDPIDDVVLDIKPGDSYTVRSGQVHWTVSSAQMVTWRPASAGPSQICWPPIHKSPAAAPACRLL
jgi:hypothetical protein